jgi:hypothetical protein
MASLDACRSSVERLARTARSYLGHRVAVTRAIDRHGIEVALATSTRRKEATETHHRQPERVERWALSAVDRLLWRWPFVPNTCLYRAAARYCALRDLGYPVRFVMGVRSDGGELVGHAWIEVDGVVFEERQPLNFRPTFVYPEDVR